MALLTRCSVITGTAMPANKATKPATVAALNTPRCGRVSPSSRRRAGLTAPARMPRSRRQTIAARAGRTWFSPSACGDPTDAGANSAPPGGTLQRDAGRRDRLRGRLGGVLGVLVDGRPVVEAEPARVVERAADQGRARRGRLRDGPFRGVPGQHPQHVAVAGDTRVHPPGAGLVAVDLGSRAHR